MESLKNYWSRISSANTKDGKRKIKVAKRKSELIFKTMKKDLKETRHSLLALKAPTSPTVADTQKGTPALAVSGAGTEMTLFTEGT